MALIDFDGGGDYAPWMKAPDAGPGGRPAGGLVVDPSPAPSGGGFGVTDPKWNAPAPPTNTNPYFDPTTNIVPGQDIPLKGNAPAAAAPATASGNRTDAAMIRAKVAQWAGMAGADPSLGADPEYWVRRIIETGGLGADNESYWQNAGVGAGAFFRNPNRESAATGGGAYSATNPFSDPATKGYVDLLNSRIQSLLTPQNNPDMAPLLDYMRKYFASLQNPAYTDAQRAVIQTQQLDPMERQRQVELKNVANVMASRGITPGSGPYLQAERDINQKYDSMRAGTQGNIATNEINLGRQNQQQAVDVGSAIASLNNGMFQQQDQRANQAVGYAKNIPDLAQQRLSQSIQLLNGSNVNPASLLTSQQGFQQQGINQNGADSQYWGAIIQALAKAFGL